MRPGACDGFWAPLGSVADNISVRALSELLGGSACFQTPRCSARHKEKSVWLRDSAVSQPRPPYKPVAFARLPRPSAVKAELGFRALSVYRFGPLVTKESEYNGGMPNKQCSVCNEKLHASDATVCDACSKAQELALEFSMPSVNLNDFEIDGTTMRMLSSEQRTRLRAVPLFLDGDTLTVAFEKPTPANVEAVRAITQKSIEPVVASAALMQQHCAELN